MKEYVYYWYYHGYISVAEQENIIKHILSHDYDGFMEFYNWYQKNPLNNPEGWTYFPDHISVFDREDDNFLEHINLFDRDNFNKITDSECECG